MLKIIEKHGKNSDGCATYRVSVTRDGRVVAGFSAYPCEPEDAILERDLDFAYEAVSFFKLGLEAGQRGETVEYESIRG